MPLIFTHLCKPRPTGSSIWAFAGNAGRVEQVESPSPAFSGRKKGRKPKPRHWFPSPFHSFSLTFSLRRGDHREAAPRPIGERRPLLRRRRHGLGILPRTSDDDAAAHAAPPGQPVPASIQRPSSADEMQTNAPPRARWARSTNTRWLCHRSHAVARHSTSDPADTSANRRRSIAGHPTRQCIPRSAQANKRGENMDEYVI